MITSPAQASAIGLEVKREHVKRRQFQVVQLRQAGLTREQIAQKLGVTMRTVYRDLEALAETVQEADELIEDACVTSEDAHLKLTKMFDARIQELFDDNWNVLPKSQWPEPWKSWALLTEIKVEDIMVQDDDGDGQTWKKSGGKRVTVKGPDVLRTIELAMKHKAVNAMVQQGTQIDVNIAVVTAEQARTLSAAQKRLSRVVEAKVIEEPVDHEAK